MKARILFEADEEKKSLQTKFQGTRIDKIVTAALIMKGLDLDPMDLLIVGSALSDPKFQAMVDKKTSGQSISMHAPTDGDGDDS